MTGRWNISWGNISVFKSEKPALNSKALLLLSCTWSSSFHESGSWWMWEASHLFLGVHEFCRQVFSMGWPRRKGHVTSRATPPTPMCFSFTASHWCFRLSLFCPPLCFPCLSADTDSLLGGGRQGRASGTGAGGWSKHLMEAAQGQAEMGCRLIEHTGAEICLTGI